MYNLDIDDPNVIIRAIRVAGPYVTFEMDSGIEAWWLYIRLFSIKEKKPEDFYETAPESVQQLFQQFELVEDPAEHTQFIEKLHRPRRWFDIKSWFYGTTMKSHVHLCYIEEGKSKEITPEILRKLFQQFLNMQVLYASKEINAYLYGRILGTWANENIFSFAKAKELQSFYKHHEDKPFLQDDSMIEDIICGFRTIWQQHRERDKPIKQCPNALFFKPYRDPDSYFPQLAYDNSAVDSSSIALTTFFVLTVTAGVFLQQNWNLIKAMFDEPQAQPPARENRLRR